MSEDDWPPEGSDTPAYVSRQMRPMVNPEDEDMLLDIGVTHLLMMLEPGDEVLWPDRKLPLDVIEQSGRSGRVYSDGRWMPDTGWAVKGLHGGEYFVGNWQTRNTDGFGRLTPNIYNENGWESEGKPGEFAVYTDDEIHMSPLVPASDLDDLQYVVYRKPARDTVYLARVVDTEFGQPVVERKWPAEGSVEREAINIEAVDAYRAEGSA